jgi:hypothetical protein
MAEDGDGEEAMVNLGGALKGYQGILPAPIAPTTEEVLRYAWLMQYDTLSTRDGAPRTERLAIHPGATLTVDKAINLVGLA